jgi:exodeoxyribonuclease V alpha subunit
MAFDIKKAISAAKAKNLAAAPDKPAAVADKSAATRSILFGTGFTKRLAEQAQNAAEKQSEQSSTIVAKTPDVDTPDSPDFLHLTLPDTLSSSAIVLDPSQQTAVDGLINQQFGCLIGAAGTGKTTTMKALLAALIRQANAAEKTITVAFCAYTGRAVQQMKRALPIEFHKYCDTIHGTLEFAPETIEQEVTIDGEIHIQNLWRFIEHRNEANPLDCNVLIIDEGGMVPIELINKLFLACKPGTRVYILGDINQLPPVHGRSVLPFAMLKWPTFELNRIHRTEENAIIDGAHAILNGKMPSSVDGRVVLLPASDDSIKTFQKTVQAVQTLSNAGKFNCLSDAIIVPQNRGTLGQEHFNERLCSFFNPTQYEENLPLNPRTIITAGSFHMSFAAGDKVMATKNDREQGITNGMIGVIQSIILNPRFRGQVIGDLAGACLADDFELDIEAVDAAAAIVDAADANELAQQQASHIVRVKFQNIDEPIDFSTTGAMNTLKHSYAFTCHKSQGGEYPVVMIVVHSANLNMLTREWLYTAWTRASGKIILIYNSRGIQHALNRQAIKGATLADKAKVFLELMDRQLKGEKIETPNLPEPVEIKE